ncbi:uncharacterized protein LOC128857619 [Anastrepha ludens]|uniref:uncharacterized protein LOC128857619 n=1 Tax=Anastrepha ludens TaxID=28586 RepID=UPI0023B1743D|nr:uncharacterized protein LOC128857619 [Anastrepha ludens]
MDDKETSMVPVVDISGVSFSDYVQVDEDDAISGLTDGEILSASDTNEKGNDEDEDDTSEPLTAVLVKVARASFDNLQSFYLQNKTDETAYQALLLIKKIIENSEQLQCASNQTLIRVIPHHKNIGHNTSSNTNSIIQRRHGGSLRCPTHSNSVGGEGANLSVGRSSSFRVNRPRNPAATYGSGAGNKGTSNGSEASVGNSICSSIIALNRVGQNAGSSGVYSNGDHTGNGSNSESGGSGSGNGNLFCKHIKYCCLHQQYPPTVPGTASPPHQQSQPKQQQPTQPKSPHKHRSPKQSTQMQLLSSVTVPPAVGAMGHYLQHAHHYQSTGGPHATDYKNDINGSIRLGPDGEDNSGGDGSKDRQQFLHSGQQLQQQHPHHQQQQQQLPAVLPKRHSVILERAFDFDASCEESDTISSTSSTSTPAELALPPPQQPLRNTTTVLKPILKKPTAAAPQYTQQPLLPLHQQQYQQQVQMKTLKSTGPTTAKTQPVPCSKDQMALHRTLPQPPKGLGFGAYHTKEAVLQRVQQQSGLAFGSRTNLNTLSSMLGSAINLAGIGGGLCASATKSVSNNSAVSACVEMLGGSASDSVSNELHYSSSNYNFDTPAKTVTTTAEQSVIVETGNMVPEQSTTLAVTPACCAAATTTGNSTINVTNNISYIDLNSPTAPLPQPKASASVNKFSDLLKSASANFANSAVAPDISASINNNNHNGTAATAITLCATGRSNACTKRVEKSPLLTRRRSSSIVTNLLASDISYKHGEGTTLADITNLRNNHTTTTSGNTTTLTRSGTRDRITLAKSPVSGKPSRLPSLQSMVIENTGSFSGGGGVLTFQQVISGAVSPQYSSIPAPLFGSEGGGGVGGSIASNIDLLGVSSSGLAFVLEDTGTSVKETVSDTLQAGDSPTMSHPPINNSDNNGLNDNHYELDIIQSEGGVAGVSVDTECVHTTTSNILHSSSSTIAHLQSSRHRQRMRTSSMPAESRKPRLADTRRAAIHCADLDLEYYRLRSFSITSHGVCNLGDSLRRRSRSINSVTSTGTSNSGKDRNNSNASHTSGDNILESTEKQDANKVPIPAYKIAMLGTSGVGKTTLTYQFTTSDYICAYDLSLDDDYGQKTVSVLVDGIETDLEIIDHPACEMSTEAFCSTYNIDLFVVVYSVVDRNSFKAAEKVLQYLKEHEMLLTRGAILVGNKTDLERHREVNRQIGRKLAKEICCKFIETSSGLDHNVNELLVGIVAQAKLNPQRIRNLSERDRQRLSLQSAIQKHRQMHIAPRRMVRQVSMYHPDDDATENVNKGFSEIKAGNNCKSGDIINENHQPTTNESTGPSSEHTVSKSVCSIGIGTKPTSTTNYIHQRSNKRALNLESILKMGESELEDEEESQRHPTLFKQQQQAHPLSKFDLLISGGKNSLNSSPKSRRFYGGGAVSGAISALTRGRRYVSDDASHANYAESNDHLLDEGNRKTVSKLTNRTKVFLSSVLKFKKAVNMRRRNSSSCSDLFVI